jgi:hypothetical protein
MDKKQRLVMLGIAAVIAAVAVVFALTSGGDDDGDKDSSTAAQTTTDTGTGAGDAGDTAGDGGATAPAPDDDSAETTTEAPAEPAGPEVTVINVEGGEPVDGVKKINVKKGDTIAVTVVADAAEEVHLHGYDVAKDVGPGEKARFRQKADIEGVFEMELEHSGVQIASITVEP